MSQEVKVAAAHIAPVYMNAALSTQKAIEYIQKAAEGNVDLVVFPESFIPGFPLWPALSPPIHNHEYFKLLAANSVRVSGPEILEICRAARTHGIFVSLGISESTDDSVGCLWNSNLLIGDDGSILNHHRKIVPTFFEKLIWANGDGAGLRVANTRIGRIGALICGENTNPLARYSLIAQGEELHISSYPPTWPTHVPSDQERYDLASSIRIRAGAHSFEAKAFNIVASSLLDKSAYQVLEKLGAEACDIVRKSPKGISMVIAPSGVPVVETAADEDTLLVTTIDLDDCIAPKQFHDIVGYYNRFDIFDLKVNRRALRPANFTETGDDRQQSFSELDVAGEHESGQT